MRETLNFDLKDTREEINLVDIKQRLANKKECKTTVTRTKNKIQNAINMSYELLKSGRLKAEGEIETITTKERLIKYMEYVKEKGIYVLDLETTGLDVFNDIIVGVCLYTKGELGAYVPINHTDVDNNRLPNQLTEAEVWEILEPYLTDKNIKTIGHNIKFDGKVLKWNWKLNIGNYYFDTLVAGHLLNENEPHGLKELFWKYCKNMKGSNEDFRDYFGDTPFNYIPIEVASVYGANDGYKNWMLWEFQAKYINLNSEREDMRELAKALFNIEMPLTQLLIDMEMRGVEIREDFAIDLAEEFKAELVSCEEQLDLYVYDFIEKLQDNATINRLTKGTCKINYSSPEQLKTLLYDVWKLPSVDRKEPRGTGADILEKHKLKAQKKGTKKALKFIEFIDNLLEFRFLKKMLTTYVEKIPRVKEPKTNAVHTNFNQSGTVTGRFSSSHPIYKMNLQNIPSKEKRIRKIFRAREGYKLIGGDFSQIEPRVLAFISQDEAMIDAYNNGADLYAMMASSVYNMPIDECKEFRADGSLNKEGKMRRNSMKSVLLGIMYERGTKDIASQFNQTIEWAEELVANFKKAYPKIEQCRLYWVTHAESYGYITMLNGRKRRLPDMLSSDHDSWKYAEAHRQVLNSVIQGSAGEIMKMAMLELYHNEEFRALGGHLLITIHDELICEIPEANVEAGCAIMANCMKAVGQKVLGIKMSVDVEASHYWYEEQ